MGKRKETSVMVKILRPLVIGSLVAIAVSSVILLIMAGIMTTGVIPPAAVTPIALASVFVGSLVGGFISARVTREHGLLYGGGVGVILWLLMFIMGLVMADSLSAGTLLLKALLTVGGGALGGVLGVNVKMRR